MLYKIQFTKQDTENVWMRTLAGYTFKNSCIAIASGENSDIYIKGEYYIWFDSETHTEAILLR